MLCFKESSIFNPIPARQGLVCSDPGSFFKDHNKNQQKIPLATLRAFAVHNFRM